MSKFWDWSGNYIGRSAGKYFYAKTGESLGFFEADELYDFSGNYIGEIRGNNRLLFNLASSGKTAEALEKPANKSASSARSYVAFAMPEGCVDFPHETEPAPEEAAAEASCEKIDAADCRAEFEEALAASSENAEEKANATESEDTVASEPAAADQTLAVTGTVSADQTTAASESAAAAPDHTAALADQFMRALVSDPEQSMIPQEDDWFAPLVGDWEFDYHEPGGRDLKGEWYFRRVLQGSAIADVFICPSRESQESDPQPDAEYGMTMRMYNREERRYDMTYSCAEYCAQMQITREHGIVECRRLDVPNNRWIFFDITEDSFHWQNIIVQSSGEWKTNSEVFAHRRK